MQKIKNILLSVFIGSLFFSGCMKKETFPDTPQIQFLGFDNIYGTAPYPIKGVLALSFTDGNGDIGLSPGDTFPPFDSVSGFKYNLVITYFEKQNGQFQQVDFEIPFSARIPVLNPDDPGRAIKGIIVDTVPLNPNPVFDTIKFEAYVYDRALNKSNVISTPQIILRKR